MSSKTKARIKYVFANPQMKEEIRQNLKETGGYHEGNPCPCPDCNGTLHKKRDGYSKITEDNRMVSVDFDVFFCACGWQGRNTQEARG